MVYDGVALFELAAANDVFGTDITTASGEPLYQVLPKAKATIFGAVDVIIATEEEPLFRDFFTQVAQSCGRFVAP